MACVATGTWVLPSCCGQPWPMQLLKPPAAASRRLSPTWGFPAAKGVGRDPARPRARSGEKRGPQGVQGGCSHKLGPKAAGICTSMLQEDHSKPKVMDPNLRNSVSLSLRIFQGSKPSCMATGDDWRALCPPGTPKLWTIAITLSGGRPSLQRTVSTSESSIPLQNAHPPSKGTN